MIFTLTSPKGYVQDSEGKILYKFDLKEGKELEIQAGESIVYENNLDNIKTEDDKLVEQNKTIFDDRVFKIKNDKSLTLLQRVELLEKIVLGV